ncbi:hypothetical protein PVAP13_8KG237502 [Panicum virgatum]|uniref:Uncharacterized protein n=1 Tax=Panicum virgatum TaxID=38727 RepID=A0A8T0PPG7_PANVG|nr:hypothetical protein PVAP13_8KG237502 [Panicum virgatum]
MALVRVSTARIVYLTSALSLVLVIMMSCTSSSCRAGSCVGKPCRPPPPPAPPCFTPRQPRRCSRDECPDVCSEHGIKGCKGAPTAIQRIFRIGAAASINY